MTSLKISASSKEGNVQLELEEQGPEMPPWDAATSLDIVGKGTSRLEAFEKVTGRAQYSSDVRLTRQSYA